MFRPAIYLVVFVACVSLFVAIIHPFARETSLGYENEHEKCEAVIGWKSVDIVSQILTEGCSGSIGCQYSAHITYGIMGGAVRGEQLGPENDGKDCLEFVAKNEAVPRAVKTTILADILLKRQDEEYY